MRAARPLVLHPARGYGPRIVPGRSVTVAAALATAVLAVLVPAAGTAAPELDRAALVRELQAAYADESRAWVALSRNPPRAAAAELAVTRSRMRLLEILKDLSLPTPVFKNVEGAAQSDNRVIESAWRDYNSARKWIGLALRQKIWALGWLLPPAGTGASQCSNGLDDDRDKTVDAPYDSGCTNAEDGSERSPLTCSLGYGPGGGAHVVQGTCSGSFLTIELIPTGSKLDTKRTTADRGRVCAASESRIDCVTDIKVENPGHRVNVRFRYRKELQAAKRVKVVVTDFGGRARTWTVSQKQAPPPAETPFNFGKEPVAAVGTFNGQDVCQGLATSFTQGSEWLAPGTGTLKIKDASGRELSGPIKPSGSFDVRGAFAFRSGGESFSESYVGKITGSTATATYKYTNPSGCVSTYAVSFVLQR